MTVKQQSDTRAEGANDWDVLGLGCATVDDLLYVDDYPPADSKAQVWRRERQCGGLTATALVAAARAGARCAYASVLGDDELSTFILGRLAEEGIDTGHTLRAIDARPIHSTIVVGEEGRTRTIFFDASGFTLTDPRWPNLELIPRTKVLFVDHFGVPGMIAACRAARAAGVPIVADFERNDMERFDELLGLVDHVIISQTFAARLTGKSDPAEAMSALWNENRTAVIVTVGDQGCWCLARDASDHASQSRTASLHQPAFQVPVVDTTGCGDVFHGVYAAMLAQGRALDERVRLATAAAAMKARRHGGQAGIPTRAAIDAFLEEQSR